MYVCAQLDGTLCTAWVERANLLPPLSLEAGAILGGSVLAVYVTAWGLSLLVRQLLNQW